MQSFVVIHGTNFKVSMEMSFLPCPILYSVSRELITKHIWEVEDAVFI
jgi:hypothetical protein